MTDPQQPAHPAPGGWQPGPPPAGYSQQPGRPQAGYQAGPHQPPFPQGQPQHPQRAQPEQRRSGKGPMLAWGAGIGVLVAALVVGALLLTNVLSWGSSSSDSDAAANTTPITMPETLGGLQTMDAVLTAKNPDKSAAVIERNKRTADQTVKSYQQAYGGAAAAVQQYSNADLLFFGTAIAVRGESPGLTVGPVADPADLGLAQNMREVVTVGSAQCLVNHTVTTPAGKTPDPKNDVTSVCQRTGPGLTVQVFGNAGEDSEVSQQTMVAMAEELYAQLSGN